jgi:hypothetical protein
VPPDTNEITQVKALLGRIATREGECVIVTMDAAHTQYETAEYIAGIRRFDYIMNAKGNQPTLLNAIMTKTELYSKPQMIEKKNSPRAAPYASR